MISIKIHITTFIIYTTVNTLFSFILFVRLK